MCVMTIGVNTLRKYIYHFRDIFCESPRVPVSGVPSGPQENQSWDSIATWSLAPQEGVGGMKGTLTGIPCGSTFCERRPECQSGQCPNTPKGPKGKGRACWLLDPRAPGLIAFKVHTQEITPTPSSS